MYHVSENGDHEQTGFDNRGLLTDERMGKVAANWPEWQNTLPEHVLTAFNDLANQQRGEPEQAMLRLQQAYGGGVGSFAAEHIGDLNHRLNEWARYPHEGPRWGYTNFAPKVDKTHAVLHNPYGFEKEMEENYRSNIDHYGHDEQEYRDAVKKAWEDYGNAHEKLPAYNRPQMLSRAAASSLGFGGAWNDPSMFRHTRWALDNLKRLIDDPEEYVRQASDYRLGPDGQLLQYRDWPERQSKTAMDWMGDAYPGEDHPEEQANTNADDPVKDWSQLQFTEHPQEKVTTHNWILTGDYAKISDEDFESLFMLMGHQAEWKPIAYGTVDAYYNYEMMFHVEKSNIAMHLVEKKLKKYCRDQQLKYEGILMPDGQLWMDQSKAASWEDDDIHEQLMRGMQPDPVPQERQFPTDDLLELMKEADEIARWRGHDLIWDKTETGRYRTGECPNCGSHVQIIANPMPNEVDTSGPAISTNCTGKFSNMKVAEVPGVGRENPEKLWRIHWEDTIPVNYYGEQDSDLDTDPKGEMICPLCGEICDSYGDFLVHEQRKHNDGLGVPDVPQPVVDMDDPMPAHFNTNPDTRTDQTVNRQASAEDAFRGTAGSGDFAPGVEAFISYDYSPFEGLVRGTPVQLVKKLPVADDWEVKLLDPKFKGRHTVLRQMQMMVPPQWEATGESFPDTLPPGMEDYYHNAKTSLKTPIIPAPIPFVFDIEADKIHVGQPGHKHHHIKPDEKLTPNVVEGLFLPDGKLQFRTDSTMPYTVRYLIRLWYTVHPHLEVKRVEKLVGDKKYKLANTNIGTKVRDVAMTDTAAREVYNVLSPYGNIYAVGGAVRDTVLGKIPKDIDILAQGIDLETLVTLLNTLPGHIARDKKKGEDDTAGAFTGKDFGVIRYVALDGSEVEIALPRTEVSTGEGHKDFQVQTNPWLSVEEDLARRDFTGNAMAVDLRTGEKIDPFNGEHDLSQGILRLVDPQAFKDDPLRIVRAFSAIAKNGLRPDEETRKEIEEQAYRLRGLPVERIRDEVYKILGGSDPEAALRAMRDMHVLEYVFPEVAATVGFDQKNKHHRKTLDEHIFETVRKVSEDTNDPDVVAAMLFHDIGKPPSQWIDEKGHGHYYKKIHMEETKDEKGRTHMKPTGEESGANHEEVGAQMTHDLLTRLRYPNARRDRIVHLVKHHMFDPFNDPRGAGKFLKRVGPEHAHDLLTMRKADQEGKGTDEWENQTPVMLQRQLVDQWMADENATGVKDLAINGKDLIAEGYQPGPEFSRVLDKLVEEVIQNPQLNNKANLLELAAHYFHMRDASLHYSASEQDPESMQKWMQDEGVEVIRGPGGENLYVKRDPRDEEGTGIFNWVPPPQDFTLDEALGDLTGGVNSLNRWRIRPHPELPGQWQLIHRDHDATGQRAPYNWDSERKMGEHDFGEHGPYTHQISSEDLQKRGYGVAYHDPYLPVDEEKRRKYGYDPMYRLVDVAGSEMEGKDPFRDLIWPVVRADVPDWVEPAPGALNEPYQKERHPEFWQKHWGQPRQSNILDPIREELDEAVFTNPGATMPKLKPKLRHWVKKTIYRVLRDNGYPDPEKWLHIVLTGSLTTYQWAPDSDFDIALFITHPIPHFRRGQLVSLILKYLEGVPVPGTTHELGVYLEPDGMKLHDIFKPGLRSAYDIDHDNWIVLPERERTIDVDKEMRYLLTYAKTIADKMRLLLLYDPPGAKQFWDQIRQRWRRDQSAGRGDYSSSNIAYKYLMKHHLYPQAMKVGRTAVRGEVPFAGQLEIFDRKVKMYAVVGHWEEQLDDNGDYIGDGEYISDPMNPDEEDEVAFVDDEYETAVEQAIKYIQGHGCTQWDGGWFSNGGEEQNYRTGETTERSCHLEGWPEDEEDAIIAGVTGKYA